MAMDKEGSHSPADYPNFLACLLFSVQVQSVRFVHTGTIYVCNHTVFEAHNTHNKFREDIPSSRSALKARAPNSEYRNLCSCHVSHVTSDVNEFTIMNPFFIFHFLLLFIYYCTVCMILRRSRSQYRRPSLEMEVMEWAD
jgi:hypothetical protein